MSETAAQNIEKVENTQESNVEVKQEEAPSIKTEENKVNWQRFREEKERDRKARIEAEKEAQKEKERAEALKAALEAVVNKPQNQTYSDNGEEETEDQRIEKKINAAIEREKKLLREENEKRQVEEMPKRINQDFKDFNRVVTEENIDYLEYHHPEIASAFKYMPEGYEKWASLYKTVKKLVPNMNKNEDVKKIEQNLKKPQGNVPNITDKKPETQGWKLTEQQRMQNWRRMQEDMKSV